MMDKFGFSRGNPNPYAQPPQQQPSYNIPNQNSSVYLVDNAPDQSFVIQNHAAVPPGVFQDGQFVLINKNYVMTARSSPTLQANRIGLGVLTREWGNWSIRQEVTVEPFDIFASGNNRVYLGTLGLEIDFYNKNKATTHPYEQAVFSKRFLQLFRNQIFAPGQLMVMELGGINFKLRVISTDVVDLGKPDSEKGTRDIRGILVDQSQITFFKPKNGLINIKESGDKPRANAILQPNFRFEDMGIGGLDDEFSTIFRRAFASRIYPPKDIEKLGIKHVKGMLLYGPPGTGKTLIARQIGKMLNAREPKIVNGPEMLNKFVGGSEENIRKLFKEAEEEYKAKGDESSLHIIIFDELDAVFKQRGSRGDGTGVGDNVVNQLLAKMDGVDQLNNILVIGMTNRKDLIDSALLRPGRFEVQLEISLPDENGRKQIFKIHTAKMKHEGMLDSNVNIDELASKTKNFSGAEIEGLVKSAASFALNRNIKFDPKKGVTFNNKTVKVNRDDFLQSLDEIQPAFGVSEDELERLIRGGIINYSSKVADILAEGASIIRTSQSDQFPLTSVLIHGPAKSGKSALAASIALSSGFPFIRMISPRAMVGMTEQNRINYISNMFNDSYKSMQNVLVIDQIEDIIEWVNVGPRFSNGVLHSLKTFLSILPPENRRLVVLVTTRHRRVLEQLDLISSFNKEIYVPNVSSLNELQAIFDKTGFLDNKARQSALEQIKQQSNSTILNMGIKNILFNIESSRLSQISELEEFVKLTVNDISNQPGRINTTEFDFN